MNITMNQLRRLVKEELSQSGTATSVGRTLPPRRTEAAKKKGKGDPTRERLESAMSPAEWKKFKGEWNNLLGDGGDAHGGNFMVRLFGLGRTTEILGSAFGDPDRGWKAVSVLGFID